jgi:MoaA/NifB/PqqE/SkfB family radical SAM enzyme
MYQYNELTELHIELSSRCQASCPQCARNVNGGLPNTNLIESDISLEDYIKTVGPLIPQLKKIIYCGNYGDPLMNKHLSDIIRYTVSVNSDIHIDLHTNGSARTVEWWKELASIMPFNHTVYWGIDGGKKTHSLYRIGTDYDKIIDNACAFNTSGGNSVWTFITFKHNEHEIDLCHRRSVIYGFQGFIVKQTIRFVGSETFPVLDNEGNVTHVLETPSTQLIKFVPKEYIDNYKKLLENVSIDCEAARKKSIYIDSQLCVWPCCYLAGVPYSMSTSDYHKDNLSKINKISLTNRSIESVVNSTEWNSAWDTNNIPMCAKTCGNHSFSKPEDQFV